VAMRQRYRSNAVSLVFVLTDGRDSGAGGRAAFLARLTADQDPSRPVPVLGIGYGPGADMTALRDAARITGGQAVAANNPRDLDSAVVTMFLAAHQARSG
jgi:Ca-activated chloride channel family protein